MFDRSGFQRRDSSGKETSTPPIHKKERQKLVVRMKKGEVYYGMTFALNRQAAGFHLDLLTPAGMSLNKTLPISFADIKAVFQVKSFDGKFDPENTAPPELPNSKTIAVRFFDGETLVGRPVNPRWNEEARFMMVPEESGSNNIMALIERSAVRSIHDADTYNREKEKEYQSYRDAHFKSGMTEMECLGDFHFRKGEYGDAHNYYKDSLQKEPDNARIKSKLCAAKYNLAIHFIRQKEYPKALRFMEAVLSLDPSHAQATEKAEQLRAHMEKHRLKSS